MNPYEVLGVDRDAGVAKIKAAYRALSREHHPDKGGDEAKFLEIKEAFDILSDSARRERYDRTGRTDADRVTPEAIRSAMEVMIDTVINAERPDGTTDDPCWEDIRVKVILSIKSGRREVTANIKQVEKKLKRTRLLAKRFKSKQEHDPVGEIFKSRIESMEFQLNQHRDAMQLSVELEKAFENYSYEVGPDTEGQYASDPTPRLLGRGFATPFP